MIGGILFCPACLFVCLNMKHYASGGNKVRKETIFLHKGQHHKMIDLGVMWKGIISGACMPKMKCYLWFKLIGVLRQMQRYFSQICDGTDVHADWRSCTFGRAPNAMDIS